MTTTATALVCSLKPSPAPSSSETMARQVAAEWETLGVSTRVIRVVDFDVLPGVEPDMGAGDQWPEIRAQIVDSDIVLIATPTWVGHPSSITQRVLAVHLADRLRTAAYPPAEE